MSTALDKIIDYKREEVDAFKRSTDLTDLLHLAKQAPQPRGFKARLDEISATGENALICEVKRKSPSAGEILPGADPIAIGKEYESGGAACLSVLTDYPSFGGTLEDLDAAKTTVSIPILRKDFMVDPAQILEARAHGADCILLILAVLGDAHAAELKAVGTELGMDVLVEVHDEQELDRAIKLDADLIGVNNRNLKTMTTDLATSERLAKRYPELNMVSESGVRTPEDIIRLRRSGYRRFLIGESLMKETNRENAVRRLVMSTKD